MQIKQTDVEKLKVMRKACQAVLLLVDGESVHDLVERGIDIQDAHAIRLLFSDIISYDLGNFNKTMNEIS